MSTSARLRIARFLTNPLLQRKQFVVEILHPNGGVVSKTYVREQLANLYKISDLKRIVVGDFQTKYGGGSTIGFGRIYETSAAALKFEQNYRLVRLGIAEKETKINRGLKKSVRNQKKKLRGTAKAKLTPSKK